MWISPWGEDCIEELICIFSLSNTKHRSGDDSAMTHFEKNNGCLFVFFCSFVAQTEGGKLILLSELIVMVKYIFC